MHERVDGAFEDIKLTGLWFGSGLSTRIGFGSGLSAGLVLVLG